MSRSMFQQTKQASRTVLPEVEWTKGFGQRLAGLLRRYGGEEARPATDDRQWWTRPWSDADRERALQIDLDGF